jgi:hypothetical protein
VRGTEALAAYPQEISYHEWWRLWSYVSALSISDVEGHSLWLVVNDGKRTWHYETPFMHFELCRCSIAHGENSAWFHRVRPAHRYAT